MTASDRHTDTTPVEAVFTEHTTTEHVDLTAPGPLAVDVAAVVDTRVAARILDAQRRRDEQRAERKWRTVRRNAGLRVRHATKLARLTQEKAT